MLYIFLFGTAIGTTVVLSDRFFITISSKFSTLCTSFHSSTDLQESNLVGDTSGTLMNVDTKVGLIGLKAYITT